MPVSGSVQGNYRILVSRGDRRPRAELYVFNLEDEDAIPTFSLPLRSPDVEPAINLHPLLNLAYDRAGYSVVIDYNPGTSRYLWKETLI